MKKILIQSLFLCFLLSANSFGLNKNNSWNQNKIVDYDSLYFESLSLIQKDNISESIKNLNEIIIESRNKALILNSYYDLAQIYLSRSSNYEQSIKYFQNILNNSFSYRLKSNSNLKEFSELKEKSLFMIGYVYHNHIGNLSKAQYYYNLFLKSYDNSDLSNSVIYELDVINKSIQNFNE